MRIAVLAIQIFVGVLFIVSGLVKANDPLGLAYKMEEFFELWNSGLKQGSFFLKDPLLSLFTFFHGQSLVLSIVMITLEVIAGIALIIGWKKRFILSLLMLLMIFFTFLTGYAYLSGKFTNCGCFGDCLPITPFTSFVKDLVLLVLIIFLIATQHYIRPLLSHKVRNIIMGTSLLLTLLLQWYVLNYLPIVDCLPFKKANNISQKMKPPPGSVPDSIAIRFIYEKDGKRFEFAPESLPEDFTTYKYIDRIDKVVRKGNADAPIKGFSLIGETIDQSNGNKIDSTQIVLSQPAAILLFVLDFNDSGWINEFKKVADAARQKEIPIYILSSSSNAGVAAFSKYDLNGYQFYNIDFTTIRTAARTNPTVYLLKEGTIVNKYGVKDLSNAAKDIAHESF